MERALRLGRAFFACRAAVREPFFPTGMVIGVQRALQCPCADVSLLPSRLGAA